MNAGTKQVDILVADQLELVANGLRHMFRDSHLNVCGYVHTGFEALEWLQHNSVDIVMLDVSLPEMDGIDTTRAIHKQFPNQILLAHSVLQEIEYVNSMLIEGAVGYVIKNANLEEIETAVEHALKGEQYLSTEAAESVAAGYAYTEKRMDGEYIGLTMRERSVIRLIALEKTNQEIADELFLSVETIRTYRKSLLTKLNVRTSAGLVKYALDRRWI